MQGIGQKGVHPKSKDGTKGAKKKIVELWCTGASYEANQATEWGTAQAKIWSKRLWQT